MASFLGSPSLSLLCELNKELHHYQYLEHRLGTLHSRDIDRKYYNCMHGRSSLTHKDQRVDLTEKTGIITRDWEWEAGSVAWK